MRAAFAALAAIVIAVSLPAWAQGVPERAEPMPANGLFGEWWTPGFNARVRIEPCADAVCARIVWLWDETPKDIADKSPLIGRRVVEGMRLESAQRWSGGRLYNPEDGRDYKGSLQLQGPHRLLVDGCVLFLCRQQVWRRFDSQRSPPVAAAAAER